MQHLRALCAKFDQSVEVAGEPARKMETVLIQNIVTNLGEGSRTRAHGMGCEKLHTG